MKRFCILGLMALALSCFNALPALAATPIGKLYTMGNASAGNAVLVYTRYSDGSLTGPLNDTDEWEWHGRRLGQPRRLGNQ